MMIIRKLKGAAAAASSGANWQYYACTLNIHNVDDGAAEADAGDAAADFDDNNFKVFFAAASSGANWQYYACGQPIGNTKPSLSPSSSSSSMHECINAAMHQCIILVNIIIIIIIIIMIILIGRPIRGVGYDRNIICCIFYIFLFFAPSPCQNYQHDG